MPHKPPPHSLQALRDQIHQLNSKWWHDPRTGARLNRNPFELLALVVSELVEALEGERKDLMDDKLPHRKMAEVEMADALIRLFDFAGGFDIPLLEWEPAAPSAKGNKGEFIYNLIVRTTEIGMVWISSPKQIARTLGRCIACIESYCTEYDYDLWGAMEEKLGYNATRIDHTHEARLLPGGKKF